MVMLYIKKNNLFGLTDCYNSRVKIYNSFYCVDLNKLKHCLRNALHVCGTDCISKCTSSTIPDAVL